MSPYRNLWGLRQLDRWRLSIIVTYFAGFIILVFLISLSAKVNKQEAERKVQIAKTSATTQANYDRCIASITSRSQINAYADGAETVANVLLANSRALHAATPRESPMFRVQAANIVRLERAINLTAGRRLPVPTVAECKARRDAEENRG